MLFKLSKDNSLTRHFEGTEARDIATLSYSIFNSVFQFLVTLGRIELLGAHRGVSNYPLSFRRGSSSRRVYDFNCRKFDIKCMKENVENISGFPVTSQLLANQGNVSPVAGCCFAVFAGASPAVCTEFLPFSLPEHPSLLTVWFIDHFHEI